jgi:hypothetical protein
MCDYERVNARLQTTSDVRLSRLAGGCDQEIFTDTDRQGCLEVQGDLARLLKGCKGSAIFCYHLRMPGRECYTVGTSFTVRLCFTNGNYIGERR